MSNNTAKRKGKAAAATAPSIPPLTELHSRLERIPAAQPLLLRLPSGVHKQVTLKAGTTVSLGKYGCFRASDLIGLPFGHTFEILGGSTGGNDKRAAQKRRKEMERANEKRKTKGEEEKHIPEDLIEASNNDDKAGELRIVVEAPPAEIEATDATNENFSDLNSAQKLTMLDIHALKDAGVEGRQIIQQASESNATFAQKTAYAQDKYVKRKEQKHLRLFTPLAPSLSHVASFNFERQPEKVHHMRPDALAQLLSFANVGAGGRYIVVDGVGGALVGAVLERLGGQGRVLLINDTEGTPTLELLSAYHLSRSIIDPVLRSIHWAATERAWRSVDVPIDPDAATETPAGKPLLDRDRQRLRKRRAVYDEFERNREELFGGDFDGMIVATGYEPVSVISRLVPFLAGSGSIALHSPYLQPLVEAHAVLRLSNDLLNLSITEPWLRRYQVLPGRTHPEMSTSSTAGYILSGIRVFKDDAADRLVLEASREGKAMEAETAVGAGAGESRKRGASEEAEGGAKKIKVDETLA